MSRPWNCARPTFTAKKKTEIAKACGQRQGGRADAGEGEEGQDNAADELPACRRIQHRQHRQVDSGFAGSTAIRGVSSDRPARLLLFGRERGACLRALLAGV